MGKRLEEIRMLRGLLESKEAALVKSEERILKLEDELRRYNRELRNIMSNVPDHRATMMANQALRADECVYINDRYGRQQKI